MELDSVSEILSSFLKRSISNFSLQNHHIFKQTSNENNKNHQLVDSFLYIILIYNQIFRIELVGSAIPSCTITNSCPKWEKKSPSLLCRVAKKNFRLESSSGKSRNYFTRLLAVLEDNIWNLYVHDYNSVTMILWESDNLFNKLNISRSSKKTSVKKKKKKNSNRSHL